jgi:deazaflavin-dependent oxidoreductase (nitroreductase family)
MAGLSSPPRGLLRWLARLPTLLYRWRAGWLLGHRFLMLVHTGRRSGKTRTVVLEVLRHDPLEGCYIVASGWGERADWYRNLRQTPDAVIEVAGRRHAVTATFLETERAGQELARYAAAHPLLWRLLFLVLKGSEERRWEDLSQRLRLVRLAIVQ